MTSKWAYLARTTPNIDNLLQPLEIIIRTNFAPALTNRSPPNDTERDLLAMPARLGGIALTNPTQGTEAELLASRNITQPLKDAILQQNPLYTEEMVQSQLEAQKEVKEKKARSRPGLRHSNTGSIIAAQKVCGPSPREGGFKLAEITSH